MVLEAGAAVNLTGVARDAALGAVVVLGDGQPVYVEGLERWPNELLGRKVEVSGTAAQKKLAPDPEIAPDGAVSHGMVGTAWVVSGATWRRASP